VGILGSLPSHIDTDLLASWQQKVPEPQGELVNALLACTEADSKISYIGDDTKQALANAVRTHYKKHPKALALQASGNIIPTTVSNHR